MGRRGYPPEFRRKVLDLVDRGLEPGLTSSEQAELAVAKRRIAELETELHAMRRAMELVRAMMPPKGGSRRSR